MIQDVRVANREELSKTTEGYDAIQDFFLDGPISKRVAILDIDPKNGKLNKGVKLNKNATGKLYYADASGKDIRKYKGLELYKPEFLQVSTFATVLKTLDLFEKEGTVTTELSPEAQQLKKFGVIGRELKWAFDAPHLLVIPRAGEMANAYYNRDTHSLEFFFFSSQEDENKIIYSALSREIVAHETGHAIIDAIAPELMDAYTPDSLALHEGLADLIALFVSFSSTNLSTLILNQRDGSIREESHFSNLAEEFAIGLGHEKNLRNFLNEKNLIKTSKNYVNSMEPHTLCEVLTGAIYKVILDFHDSEKKRLAKTDRYKNLPNPLFSASGFALVTCYQRIKRVLFRALDFLPPGEITFADYGRAIAAADRVESKINFLRVWFAEEFVNRGITSSKALLLNDNSRETLINVDFNKLITSNWYAHEFAKKNRKLLLIPARTNYEVNSCHIVNYYTGKSTGKKMCLFKVSWMYEEEENLGDDRLPNKRLIKMGTTLVMDIEKSKIHARLTNAYPINGHKVYGYNKKEEEYKSAKLRRTSFLKHLFSEGMLKIDQEVFGPDGQVLQNIVRGEIINGVLQVKGAAKALHICK